MTFLIFARGPAGTRDMLSSPAGPLVATAHGRKSAHSRARSSGQCNGGASISAIFQSANAVAMAISSTTARRRGFMLRLFGGVASCRSNHWRRGRARQKNSQNDRANSEQSFGRSGRINRRSILRSASAAASGRRSSISTASAKSPRVPSPSFSPKCSTERAA